MSFPKSRTTWLSGGEMEGEINAKSIVEWSSTVELGDGGMTYIFLYITFFTSCSHPFKFYFYPLLANPYFPPNSALAVILFFISQSLCSLSLSFVLSACITTHTCSISLSLFLHPCFYISLFSCLSLSVILLFSVPLPQVLVSWMLCTRKH